MKCLYAVFDKTKMEMRSMLPTGTIKIKPNVSKSNILNSCQRFLGHKCLAFCVKISESANNKLKYFVFFPENQI